MKNPAIPLISIFSVLWIVGGTWWLSSLVCGSEAAAVVSPVSEGFYLSDEDFTTQSTSTFYFDREFATVEFDEAMSESFREIAAHLSANPDRVVVLQGLFTADEQFASAIPDLGLARAESIRELLIKYGVEPNQIRITSVETNEEKFVSGKIPAGVEFSFEDLPAESMLEPTDPIDAQLTYDFSDRDFKLDTDTDTEAQLDQWLNYLDVNNQAKVVVEAYPGSGTGPDEGRILTSQVSSNARRVLRNYGFASREVVARPQLDDGGARRIVIRLER